MTVSPSTNPAAGAQTADVSPASDQGSFYPIHKPKKLHEPAKAGLTLWPASACLATALADELALWARPATPAGFQDGYVHHNLSHIKVILPTKRLATWITALLAERLGVYVPPRFLGFEEYIHAELQARASELVLGDTQLGDTPLGDAEQELLLLSLIKARAAAGQAYQHLAPGHEHEIKQFFSELWDWNVGEAAFPRLIQALEKDLGFSDASLTTLHERTDELDDLYRSYLHALNERQLAPASLLSARRSQALASILSGMPLSSMSSAAEIVADFSMDADDSAWTYLVGFTSLAGKHDALLQRLVHQTRLSIWMNAPLDLQNRKNPLLMLQQTLTQAAPETSIRQQPWPTSTPLASQQVRIHQADDAMGEVATAFSLAQSYIQAGCPPSAIAILVTDDSTYGKPLRYFAQQLQLNCNLAVTTPLSQTIAGRFLSAWVEHLIEPDDPHRLLTVLTHPLALEQWRDLCPHLSTLDDARLRACIMSILCRPQSVPQSAGNKQKTSQNSSQSSPQPSDADFLLYKAHMLLLLQELSDAEARQALPLPVWQEKFSTLVERLALATGTLQVQEVDIGLRAAVKEQFRVFYQLLENLHQHIKLTCRSADFLALLRNHLLTADVRSVGGPLQGIQVLSVAEARYIPFQVVIVLGCYEGCFPRAVPRDLLVDHYLKSLIGLPGWQLLEAIEDTTFRLLLARIPHLHLLYASHMGKEELVRSRFLEPLIYADKNCLSRAEQSTSLQQLLEQELFAVAAIPPAPMPLANHQTINQETIHQTTVHQTTLERLRLHQQSASSLERLIHCPYSFLLQRFGVREQKLPDPTDPKQEGEWLHEVVAAFFTGEARGERYLPALKQEDLDLAAQADCLDFEFIPFAVHRLCELTRALGPRDIESSPLYLQLQEYSWPAFAKHVAQLATKGLRASELWQRERAFGYTGTASVSSYTSSSVSPSAAFIASEGLQLRGSVDAVDHLAHGITLITDYKRQGCPERQDVLEGVAPQLPVYAIGLASETAMERMILGYYSILGGQWHGIAAGSAVLETAREAGLVPAGRKRSQDDTNKTSPETVEALSQQVHSLWQWRMQQLLTPTPSIPLATPSIPLAAHSFQPDPSNCGFCHASGVCRKNDPRYADSFAQADALTRYLAQQKKTGEPPA